MADMEKENTMAETDAVDTAAENVAAKTSVNNVPASEKQKKKKKDAKPNFFVRLGRRLAKFFRDYNSERKKISWKPWREVCKSALIVVVTVVSFSVVIFGIDKLFMLFFGWLAGVI